MIDLIEIALVWCAASFALGLFVGAFISCGRTGADDRIGRRDSQSFDDSYKDRTG